MEPIGIFLDKNEIRLAKANEIVPGKTFYLLNADGSFSMCEIAEEELSDPQRRFDLRATTTRLSKENKLYFNRIKPGQNFVKDGKRE